MTGNGRPLEILEIQMQILEDMKVWCEETSVHFPLAVIEAMAGLGDVAHLVVDIERSGRGVTDEDRVVFAKAFANLFRMTCLATTILDIKLEEAYKLVRRNLVDNLGDPRLRTEPGEAASTE